MELVKEYTELVGIKCLGAIQKCHQTRSTSSQEVAGHFHHKPRAFCSASTRLETELQAVCTQSVPPQKNDQVVKQFDLRNIFILNTN